MPEHAATSAPSELRARVRADRLEHLSRSARLVAEAVESLTRAGVHVHEAPTSADALAYVDGLPPGTAVTSPSATLEEIGLAAHLRSHGTQVNHTETGSADDAAHAVQAHTGFTGANALIADIGTIVVAEEQGNARLVSNLPPVHVCVAGIDKVVPTTDDALALLRVASRSALGREVANYLSFITGPSKTGDIGCRLVPGMHGPGEVHVVFLDNGRMRAVSAGLAELLLCVGCGACTAAAADESSAGKKRPAAGNGGSAPYLRPSAARRLLWWFAGRAGEADAQTHVQPPSREACVKGAAVCPLEIPLDEMRARVETLRSP